MNESVEEAVADYLGSKSFECIDWNKLKPVMCFVVLWNRLEESHDCELGLRNLLTRSKSVVRKTTFDIARYEHCIEYFQNRYRTRPQRIDSLLGSRLSPAMKSKVKKLVMNKLSMPEDRLEALMIIPYRIRNNLFHGDKSTRELYDQAELFENVNKVVCQFHADIR